MSLIAPGTPVPAFTLRREDFTDFTREDLLGQTTVLVFYPHAFSPGCTDQLQVYEEAVEDLRAEGATLYGVSTDSVWAQKAFRENLGITIEQLSDFEPKGATARGFGAYAEAKGTARRALVIVDPDGIVRFSHAAVSPGEVPGVGLIFDGLAEIRSTPA
ncbi:MAG TPA: redoxin domain-containing protein [Solirubrobacteraceae bacterium]